MSEFDHPDDAALADFLSGRLMEVERAAVELHIADCAVCCQVLNGLPHDGLVARLRAAGTHDSVSETLPGRRASTPTLSSVGEVPRELAEHPRYRIIEPLGVGGMGAVYLAEHRLMERRVAVKVIHPQFVHDSQAVERFRQEVKAAARLAHRNIVAAYDAEQAGGLHFLAMEYVEGINLAVLVDRRGRLQVLHACNYAMQAALGLQHAHEHGMVHRDIKPQNLMRTPRGTVKILDFGLARLATSAVAGQQKAGLTSAGTTMGTPDYIAPEQARDSRQADIRSDVYSLGCTLYFLLTGRVPFPGGTALEKVVAHFQQTPLAVTSQRNDVPGEVAAILARMMAKNPAERFQEPREVAEALRPFALPGEPIRAATAVKLDEVQPDDLNELISLPQKADRHSASAVPWQDVLRRHRRGLLLVAAALCALMAAVFIVPGLLRDRGQDSTIASRPIIPTGDEEWTDLLPNIQPERDTVSGRWRKEDGALHVDANEGARIMIATDVPREYDFEVELTRTSGKDSLPLMFVANGRQATFEIDAWEAGLGGIQVIAGQDLRGDNPTRVAEQRITNGRKTVLMVSVRRDRVEGYVDGRLIATHRGDGSDLSMLPPWSLPRKQVLGLGSYMSAATFHRVRMRPR